MMTVATKKKSATKKVNAVDAAVLRAREVARGKEYKQAVVGLLSDLDKLPKGGKVVGSMKKICLVMQGETNKKKIVEFVNGFAVDETATKKKAAPKVSDRESRAKAGMTKREEQGGEAERMSEAHSAKHLKARALAPALVDLKIGKKIVSIPRLQLCVLAVLQQGGKDGMNKPMIRAGLAKLFGIYSESNVGRSSVKLSALGYVKQGRDTNVGSGNVSKLTDAGRKVNTSSAK